LASIFLDTLKQVLNIDEFEFPQYGEIPYPKEPQGHYWDMPARYFYYNSEDDFKNIEDILRDFKGNYIKDKEGILLQFKIGVVKNIIVGLYNRNINSN
jgi:hypothetical protein